MAHFDLKRIEPLRERERVFREWYLTGCLPGDPFGSEQEQIEYRKAAEGRIPMPGENLAAGEKPVVKYDIIMEMNRLQKDRPVHLYQHGRYIPLTLHEHDYYELVCVVKGKCRHTIGDDHSSLADGDIAVIPPGTLHNIMAFSDDCIVFNLGLKTGRLRDIFHECMAVKHPLMSLLQPVSVSMGGYLIFHTGDYLKGDNLLAELEQEQRAGGAYTNQILLSLLQTFLLHLIRHFSHDVIYFAGNSDTLEERLLLYIRNHFRTITLRGLQEQFHYSERQLQRIIHRATGGSFSEYIAERRLEYVAVQLRESTVPVAQIAAWAGFSNMTFFYRAFEQRFGMTPREYRQKKERE